MIDDIKKMNEDSKQAADLLDEVTSKITNICTVDNKAFNILLKVISVPVNYLLRVFTEVSFMMLGKILDMKVRANQVIGMAVGILGGSALVVAMIASEMK